MASQTTACASCGDNNAFYHLWCQRCQTPLPYTVTMPPAQNRQQLVERKTLYEKLLADLQGLQQSETVAAATFAAIDDFYRHQLAVIGEAIDEQQRVETVHQLVVQARRLAHDEGFPKAIELLQEAASSNRGSYPLDLVIAEVTAKKVASDHAAEAARRVTELLWQARQDAAAQRFDVAREKLEQAKRINPASAQTANALISTALQEVEASLLAQRLAAAEGPSQPAAAEAELIVATLLSTPGTSQTPFEQPVAAAEPALSRPRAVSGESEEASEPVRQRVLATSFANDDEPEQPNPTQRLIDAASQWSAVIKPFLLDNVGWFVGAFLVVAGFVVLIVTFWGSIERNPILMNSLVYASLLVATGAFFSAAYFMRLRYPQLESSSNVLLVIVVLLIPLVFAAAMLTSLVPIAAADVDFVHNSSN